MKVLVIGATGLTGAILVKHLIARHHEVTAFVRDPARLQQRDLGLKVAVGEARDASSLERAIDGQDAVVAAFGPRSLKNDDLQEVFMRHLVAAMTKGGVKRLVNLSAMGAGDSRPSAPFFFRGVIMPLILRHLFADKDRGEAHLFASALDYVNVRPGRLTNGPPKGGVKASSSCVGLKPTMSREDLAMFMIEQLDRSEWVRKSPVIGY